MIDLYKITNGKNVYLEEDGKRINVEKLTLEFNKDKEWIYYAKLEHDKQWYVINALDDKCKIVIDDNI